MLMTEYFDPEIHDLDRLCTTSPVDSQMVQFGSFPAYSSQKVFKDVWNIVLEHQLNCSKYQIYLKQIFTTLGSLLFLLKTVFF